MTYEMMCRRFSFILFFLLAFGNAFSQESPAPEDSFLAMFWNVENFFDIHDDPETQDDEFTYKGKKKWFRYRFDRKKEDIARTILAVGDRYGELPSIIGLAEVENASVLAELLGKTLLSKLNYGYIHRDSPDARGIDVALLYDRKALLVQKIRTHEVRLPQAGRTTRDILEVTAYSYELHQRIHIFVNHWPSKLGGEKISLPNRMAAARTLRGICDSLTGRSEHILIMGDFNDTPDSAPIQYLCSGKQLTSAIQNLFQQHRGTLKYKGKWELIDQFIVSSHSFSFQASIFDAEYLLEADKTYLGVKPDRTYFGPFYHGGISDHLPLILHLSTSRI